MSLLGAMVRRALDGEPAAVMIEGPAGVGKSRLLAAARTLAQEAGLRTLGARGSELERELAFGVVRQWFEPALRGPSRRGTWLSGAAAAAERVFDPSRAPGGPFEDGGFSVIYGLSWLTANVAEDGPLLLVVDDLQWCDHASLRFLAYLVARWEGLRALLVATVRTGEPGPDWRLLGEIGRDPSVVSVRPRELSEDAVGELVQECLGAPSDPRFTAACRQATGGNPLLLVEVLKTLRAEGVRPDHEHVLVIRDLGGRAVSPAVLLRLARLPDEATAVARAVAVLGDGAALPATAALAGVDEPRVAEAARLLAAAGILAPEASLSFVHPLVRDAVYFELAPAERALYHERAATVLGRLGTAPELVAPQLLLAPRRSDAHVVTLLRRAAAAAARRGDPDTAVAYLRRALEEPPGGEERAPLLSDLGMAEALADDKAGAAEHLRAALETAVDVQERATIAEALSRALLFTAPAGEAAAVARRVGSELPEELADAKLRLEALELLSVAFGASVPAGAERLEAARAGLRGTGPGARMLAVVAAADWALCGGAAAECCDLVLTALDGGVLVAAEPALMPVVAATMLGLADHDEVPAVWEAISAAAHRTGSVLALGGLYVCQGATWLARGELDEAQATFERANQEVRAWSSAPAEILLGAAYLAEVLVERGEVGRAKALLGTQPEQPPGSEADSLLRRAAVGLLLGERRWAEARRAAEAYAGSLRPRIVNPVWAPWRSLEAVALAGLGRHGEALALLEDELVWARRWGTPRAIGRALRLLGTTGPAPRLELLREAVASTDGSPARLEHAKSLVALGSALRLDRKPAAAREPLRQGLELAIRCGAAPLAGRARAELHAAGGRPRRDMLTGPGSLTPSERRVAELAAKGASNREIAQELFVTPRTVEFHLTGVYRKLGVSARTALSEALAGRGAT